jgi:L-fuculose-phosphate aldolase
MPLLLPSPLRRGDGGEVNVMGLKNEILRYSKLCYQNGYIKAADGNISVRTKKNFILSTAAETYLGRIKTTDLVKLNLKGKRVQGKKKPSTEIKMHLYIYSKRKDVNAVVHTHAKFASAFAAAGLALDKPVLPEIYLAFGKIPLAKYAAPSTDEVPASMENYVMDSKAILLANHGLVTLGRTLEEAYYLTEKAEQFAEICFYARMLGGEKTLTKQQLKKLDLLKATIYNK